MKNKVLLSILFVVALLGLVFTTSVNAAGTVSVVDITNTDTLHTGADKPQPTIKTDGNTITVTYNAASLKIIGAGESEAAEGRPAGYAWLGIRITAPTDATKYKVNGTDETSITGGTVDAYFGVSEEKLEEATRAEKDLTYTRTYSWLKDEGTVDPAQTVIKVIIKASGIALYNQEDNTVQWDKEEYDKVKAEVDASKKEEDKKELDDEKKTGIESTPIIATATIAMISLAGIVIGKKM